MKVIGGLVLILALGCLSGLVVWGLWDDCITPIFGIRDITFWEALTLSWLCGFLFKSTATSSKE